MLMIIKFAIIYYLLNKYDLINWEYVFIGMGIIAILHHSNYNGEDDSHFIFYLIGITLMITELVLPITEYVLGHEIPILYIIGVPIELIANIYIIYKYFSIVKQENKK